MRLTETIGEHATLALRREQNTFIRNHIERKCDNKEKNNGIRTAGGTGRFFRDVMGGGMYVVAVRATGRRVT